MTKTCTKCGVEKDLSEFSKDAHGKYGVKSRCKQCIKEYDRVHSKIYYKQNKDKIKSYQKEYQQKNSDKIKKYLKEYRIKNKEHLSIKSSVYRQKNRERYLDYFKQYNKTRVRTERDIQRDKEWYQKNKEAVRIQRLSYDRTTQKWRWSYKYKQWRQSVYEKYEYTCQECGDDHCKVHAHHIKAARDYPELRYDVDNGICLCEGCHCKLHKGNATG